MVGVVVWWSVGEQLVGAAGGGGSVGGGWWVGVLRLCVDVLRLCVDDPTGVDSGGWGDHN